MNFPSKTIENAVLEISKLPGIGKKSALRLALHLLKQDATLVENLANKLIELKKNTLHCELCNNISDEPICAICSSTHRDKTLLCVVEDTKDVIAIENTAQYNGLYYVLGGVISPLNGIGPQDIKIEKLLSKFPSNEIKEVILALSPTIDGDTTAFYISKQLKPYELKITTIARGIPVGSELEYTDEVTLGRSILKRVGMES